MKIISLGQSGYVLISSSSMVMLDPYLSDSVNREEGRPRLLPIPIELFKVSCDAVICTHDHLDHLDPDTVLQMPREQLFVTTFGGAEHLKALERNNVVSLKEGESLCVGAFEITAVFAEHSCEAFGVLIKAEGKVLYFSGDTLYNEQLFKVAEHHTDVAFICINGKLGNMNVSQAIEVAKRIGAPVNIPNHYDMFASNSENPALFADNIKGGRILRFGEEFVI